jgi:hypothetical protein
VVAPFDSQPVAADQGSALTGAWKPVASLGKAPEAPAPRAVKPGALPTSRSGHADGLLIRRTPQGCGSRATPDDGKFDTDPVDALPLGV